MRWTTVERYQRLGRTCREENEGAGSKDERNESSEEQRRKQIKEKARYRDPDNTKPNEDEFQTKTCPENDRGITKTSKSSRIGHTKGRALTSK